MVGRPIFLRANETSLQCTLLIHCLVKCCCYECTVPEPGEPTHLLDVKPISLRSLAFAELGAGFPVDWDSKVKEKGNVSCLGLVGFASYQYEYFNDRVFPGKDAKQKRPAQNGRQLA